jgi:Rrf2 family iron-sulfur cluster assembly transcriptional regulator
VIAAVNETIESTKCGGEGNCQDNEPCLTHDLWMGLSDQIRSYLSEISLGDLLVNASVNEVAKRQDIKSEQLISMPISTVQQ